MAESELTKLTDLKNKVAELQQKLGQKMTVSNPNQEQIDRLIGRINKYQDRIAGIQTSISRKERKERAHRLIQYGAIVERVIADGLNLQIKVSESVDSYFKDKSPEEVENELRRIIRSSQDKQDSPSLYNLLNQAVIHRPDGNLQFDWNSEAYSQLVALLNAKEA